MIIIAAKLPLEILTHIFEELGLEELYRCLLTSRYFRTIILDSIALQYKLKLLKLGLNNGDYDENCCLNTRHDRLAALKTRDIAWRNLTWSSSRTIPMHNGSLWELSGGVLAQGGNEKLATDSSGLPTGTNLSFHRLGSAHRGIRVGAWQVKDPSINVLDFTMDPAQDLLVMISGHLDDNSLIHRFTIHFRRLSDGAPHPLAQRSSLDHYPPKPVTPGSHVFLMQLRGEILGTLFETGHELDLNPTGIVLWNWKSSELKMTLYEESLESFAFLTSTKVLVASLELMDNDPSFDTPCLRIYDSNASPIHSCSLQLPPTFPTSRIVSIHIQADAGVVRTDQSAPFYNDPESVLFVISLVGVTANGVSELYFTLYAPLTTFLRALSHPKGAVIDWPRWGPSGTRFLPSSIEETWKCFAFGTRYVTVSYTGWHQPACVRMRDFNPHVISAERNASGTLPVTSIVDGDLLTKRVVTKHTVCKEADLFKEEVSTALPYFEVTRVLREELRPEAVMISEDSLLAVNTNSNNWEIMTF